MAKNTPQVFESLTDVDSADGETQSSSNPWMDWLELWIFAPVRVMWKDSRTRAGGLIILFFLLMGTVGVVLIPAPVQNEGPVLNPAFQDMAYPLGTDHLGQSVGKGIVHATPAMLKLAFAGGVVTTTIGVVVGTLAGFKGGLVDRVLMSAADIQMAIPGLPLLIVLAVALQPEDPLVVGFILSVDAWAGLARQLQSQVLALRNEAYVESSRTLGLSSLSIIREDILPNIMPFIMINFMGNTIRVIHASVGLYFLGVLPFTTLNWGVMINLAYNNGGLLSWRGAHYLLLPIIAINLLSFGVTLFSQGMDRLFNPRVRARHAQVTDDEGPVANVPD